MALESFAYDHPQYMTSMQFAGYTGVGSAAAVRFVAFTAIVIKAVICRPYVAGTSNDIVSAYQVLAAGGTTNTHVVGTVGSAGVATIYTPGTNTNATYAGTGMFWLAQGDVCYVAKGTDATGADMIAIEYQVLPGANVTA